MQESMIGQNIVITEPSKNLRALGRNALSGKWKTAIIAVIIYIVCTSVPTLVFDSLFGVNISNLLTSDGYTYGMDANFYTGLYNTMPSYSLLSTIYVLLVTGPFTLGLTMLFLAMFRRHKVEPVDLFLGFEQFGKALGLLLFQMLFVSFGHYCSSFRESSHRSVTVRHSTFWLMIRAKVSDSAWMKVRL